MTYPLPNAPAAVPAPVRVDWRRRLRGVVRLLAVLSLLALCATTALALIGGAYRARPLRPSPVDTASPAAKKASAAVQAVRPKGVYVVIDTFRNHLRIYKDGELLRDAQCSTGSGTVLRDPRDGRQWVFDTPIGERTIQRKVKDPIWAKPDWAFIEEGYLPPKSASERFDDFSLGKFALYMGDGYIIHGTIFQSLIGQRVTHGCVRLRDADLEWVYKTVPAGAKVYIY
jgi:L,D-transpeptidase YbiS